MQGWLNSGLFASSLATLAVVSACGGGGGTTGSGGSGGSGGETSTTTTSTTTTTTTSTSTTTTTGTGGAAPDGHSFEGALPMEVDVQIDGDLATPGVSDFYVFEGTKGQALAIFMLAQSQQGFDPDTVDGIVTLFDANQKQIAENNNPPTFSSTDPSLFTILPADGKYYLRVQECWDWASNPASSCLGTKDKSSTFYSLLAAQLDAAQKGNVQDQEKGNDAASAQEVTYAAAQGGGYYLSVIYGTYASNTDVDVYSFKIPDDAVSPGPGERAIVNNWMLRAGKTGDGSTTAMGKVYMTTLADPATHVAELYVPDFGNAGARLWPPVEVGTTYLLFIEHPATSLGTNDFYFVEHGSSTSNPLELQDADNDDPMKAEILASATDGSYYLEGDILGNAADVDHFSFDVSAQPAGTKVSVACTSWRAGSGLRGFKAALLQGDGTPIPGASDVETANFDLGVPGVSIPAGQTKLLIKLSATSHDPTVTSAFYRCGIHFDAQ
jgi:hypothetical protein